MEGSKVQDFKCRKLKDTYGYSNGYIDHSGTLINLKTVQFVFQSLSAICWCHLVSMWWFRLPNFIPLYFWLSMTRPNQQPCKALCIDNRILSSSSLCFAKARKVGPKSHKARLGSHYL